MAALAGGGEGWTTSVHCALAKVVLADWLFRDRGGGLLPLGLGLLGGLGLLVPRQGGEVLRSDGDGL